MCTRKVEDTEEKKSSTIHLNHSNSVGEEAGGDDKRGDFHDLPELPVYMDIRVKC